ncbi:uncharacterized protein K489DRAFT_378469 [Dissoconium aciculare CBS 342.82]|uniref:Uncharacterized protein n=1 Tax=Dissoconium aciculare CBS 342.82 TaxID=1314786 RepID=A0A6J3M7V1_9PEZI|nr:uncharacterized protein K489DRAFT_378469 [Dissoconium aciculare CBS 342.82]KAF1824075.1 hypothetical protein K489DRAFT_378469 [Dissoconium aciculare CBS 342.82]
MDGHDHPSTGCRPRLGDYDVQYTPNRSVFAIGLPLASLYLDVAHVHALSIARSPAHRVLHKEKRPRVP